MFAKQRLFRRRCLIIGTRRHTHTHTNICSRVVWSLPVRCHDSDPQKPRVKQNECLRAWGMYMYFDSILMLKRAIWITLSCLFSAVQSYPSLDY